MKRIALLLAGAVLGTGCVVETTCDTQSASVDWVFYDSNNNPYSGCVAAGVAAVNVYVDGYLEDSVTCTDFGSIFLPSLPSGSGQIMVEGVDDLGAVLLRDWTNLDSCGETVFQSSPGEAHVSFVPATFCVSGSDYLNYSLVDWTRANDPMIASEIIGATTRYVCDTGIDVTIPFGLYEFTGIEEVTSGGTLVNFGACNSAQYDVRDVFSDLFSVAMGNSSTCPSPSTW